MVAGQTKTRAKIIGVRESCRHRQKRKCLGVVRRVPVEAELPPELRVSTKIKGQAL